MQKYAATMRSARAFLKKVPRIAWIGIGAFVVILVYVLIFFIPKPVVFSYDGDTCVRQLVIAPDLFKKSGDADFSIETKDTWKIGSVSLASASLCFNPTSAPEAGDHVVTAAPFGGWFAAKRFNLEVPEPAAAKTEALAGKTIPTTRKLQIPITLADNTYRYKLAINNEVVDCDHKEATLHCDVPALDLDQGVTYEAALDRYYDDKKVNTLVKGEVATLLPLKQTAATIAPDQEVYEKLENISFTYDKPLESAKATLSQREGETSKPIEVTVSTKENTVVIQPKEALPRKAQFVLALESAIAQDGSSLDEPLSIPFRTSGGPKVTGVSIGSSGVAQSGVITVTLDQEIANVDKIAALVTAQGANIQVAKSGNTLRVTYGGVAFCGAFSLSIKKGFESTHGVTQDEDWAFSSRATCHTSRVIGTSTQGRAIVAHTYGSGSKSVLYVGAIHGNEHSSRYLMQAWMAELEANPNKMPADTQVVVIPSANPDGVAANTRYNANQVDLNRNYDTSDWQTDVQAPNGSPLPGGGGPSRGSEAETKALAGFTRQLAPSLTMSYHSAAGYAIGNGCGNTPALAARYAELTRYRNMTGVSGAFAYQITGTYDDWICERLGRRSVLIELTTHTSSEFARHKNALWEMVRS